MLEKRDRQRIVYDSTCFDSVFIEQKEKIGIDRRIPEKDTRCRVAKGRRIDEGMPRHNHSVHRLTKKEVSEE